jgi:hypothetical protein
MVVVNLSLYKGFPSIPPIFDKHLGDQHSNGRLGNFTKTGTLDISLVEKLKKASIGLNIRGLPNTK